ncbi:MAG: class I SAM-dependent methyltransferase [Anaerolineae bacterium]|jgi:SAM-dependent methyltransferase
MLRALKSAQKSLRHGYLADILAPYVDGCDTVLDVGASWGRLAQRLSRSSGGLDVVGVDVAVESQAHIPLLGADGRELPFASNTFDCVMMIDVLHHDDNPRQLLKEAKRVSTGQVVVKDHYWENEWDLILLRCADYIGNRLYGVELPYVFLNLDSWRSLIGSEGLRIVSSSKFRFTVLDPCKHVVFDLRG